MWGLLLFFGPGFPLIVTLIVAVIVGLFAPQHIWVAIGLCVALFVIFYFDNHNGQKNYKKRK